MKKPKRYSKLKKAAIFSTALAVSTILLTGCGSDEEQKQSPNSGDTVIVNNDNSSFSDFLAGTMIGHWLGSSSSNNSNTTYSKPTTQNTNGSSTINNSTKEKISQETTKSVEKQTQSGAKNITIPNKNISNIGNKSSVSNGKTGIGSTGGRSSAAS